MDTYYWHSNKEFKTLMHYQISGANFTNRVVLAPNNIFYKFSFFRLLT